MNTASSYEMTTRLGVQIPLVRTSIQGELRDTALETTIIQHYKNDERETIEAVYTFPLPVGATLLSLEVNLNGDVLAGTVVAAKEAEEEYENAITDGDSALLLQKIDEALYTLNVGNLQPEDSAIISIRYIQLLCWQQDTLRIMYPTTIGDRYGQPAGLGLQPHQVTHEDLGVEHHADFSLHINGELSGCSVSCPSHSLTIKSGNGLLLVTAPQDGITMDRDIVISLKRAKAATGCAGYFDRDLDGKWVGWLTLNPQVSATVEQRNITIVVDCSGSMSGISNQQAKIAVREIVENLRASDMFNIVTFGSVATALFAEALPGNESNKAAAFKLITRMNADMGGTEIGLALDLAYQGTKGMRDTGDILLITDGQSYDVERVVRRAEKSGIRHFTIGVGSAVAEDMVQGLAKATGGAHELVSPNENMAEAIVRHVKRSYAARLTHSELIWPIKPEKSIPETITHAFSGDTLNLFARFDAKPEGEAVVRFVFGDQTWDQSIPVCAYSESNADSTLPDLHLARVCAGKQIQHSADAAEKQRIGLQYQLQTEQTSYLLVAKRESENDSLTGPAIRTIPQMSKANGPLKCDPIASTLMMDTPASCDAPDDYFDMPRFLRRDRSSFEEGVANDMPSGRRTASRKSYTKLGIPCSDEEASPELFIIELNQHCRGISILRNNAFLANFDELATTNIDSNLLETLRSLCDNTDSWTEADVIAIALYLFSKYSKASKGLTRGSTRTITRAYKKRIGLERLEAMIWEAFSDEKVGDSWRLVKP